MPALWNEADWDEHERVEIIHDRNSGLTAIIALHSTHLGPGAGGTRFWHYAEPDMAVRDALRLSRGMSFKNAMAGLPMGGGKAVVVLDKDGTKTTEMLHAFGDAVEAMGGQYVTAEDVGASVADMVAVATRTSHVCGLPADEGDAGGDPGPFTAYGIYLGITAAVAHKLGKDSVDGVRIAVQGCGSVGGGVARLLAKDGAKLILADINADAAQALAAETGGEVASVDEIMAVECDVLSPNALGAVLNDETIPALNCAIVAGGANNQLARPHHGQQLHDRGILYAPDYVINAGGIINVGWEYLYAQKGEDCDVSAVNARIAEIPGRLQSIWQKSEAEGRPSNEVADAMARELIGRG
ncbi:Leu/Phe/Val dehydrogenase [Aurantiacibacter sp. D1-12]|uniref:Leu/Phe/Val dehydrogenase n=1 Tax=Aurantiacibacter sp. D1-12 TaxID=2993658 RepID=UPI00237D0F0E|nr:Glu/Leu/Phe/Val dehydrogenase dimerization domain-containing protein [Aurantiacibacter sp. D1-12]MDE1466453.1 amino acid dehydrogenase [Aurantiacibacter sp. D1-12]